MASSMFKSWKRTGRVAPYLTTEPVSRVITMLDTCSLPLCINASSVDKPKTISIAPVWRTGGGPDPGRRPSEQQPQPHHHATLQVRQTGMDWLTPSSPSSPLSDFEYSSLQVRPCRVSRISRSEALHSPA